MKNRLFEIYETTDEKSQLVDEGNKVILRNINECKIFKKQKVLSIFCLTIK